MVILKPERNEVPLLIMLLRRGDPMSPALSDVPVLMDHYLGTNDWRRTMPWVADLRPVLAPLAPRALTSPHRQEAKQEYHEPLTATKSSPALNQTTEPGTRRRFGRARPKLAPVGPDEVTVQEAADLLGESKDTVLLRIRYGELSARNVAAPGTTRARYLILKEDVIRIRNTYVTATPPDKPRRKPQIRRPKAGGVQQYKHFKLEED